MKKLNQGSIFDLNEVRDIFDRQPTVPEGTFIHIQFRRFAGCPICNLHLQSVLKRADEIHSNGIKEVIFFHSSEAEVRKYFNESPFHIIADEKRKFYKKYGVEKSIWSILHPLAMTKMIWGVISNGLHLPANGDSKLGLPADVLVDSKGIVQKVKYGKHATDQWTVDELLAHVQQLSSN